MSVFRDDRVCDQNSVNGNSSADYYGVLVPQNFHGKLKITVYGTSAPEGESVVHSIRVFEVPVTRVGSNTPSWSGTMPSPTKDDTDAGFPTVNATLSFSSDGGAFSVPDGFGDDFNTWMGVVLTLSGVTDGPQVTLDVVVDIYGQQVN